MIDNIKTTKDWILKEYNNCIRFKLNPTQAIDRCYGVVMFVLNAILDEYDESLADWWDNEMLPKFRNLTKEVL